MEIKNNTDLKRVFKKIKIPIFGVSVYAFERLGPENFIENYELISLYDSKETDLIKKDLPVFCLEEKVKKRIKPRNSTTLICHPKVQEFLHKKSGDKKPIILVYKTSTRMEREAKNNNFELAVAPFRFGKKFLENKVKFRRILEKIGIKVPPGKIVPISFLANRKLRDLKKEFGFPFVVQHPQKGGGKGTFFIKDQKSFNTAKQFLRREKTEEFIITRFVKGPSPSMTGCVTRHGVISTRPQYQICDEPLLNRNPGRGGLFCGHDWSLPFSDKVLKQAKEAVDKIGKYFKKEGYKGIFGLDFILDAKEEALYVVECNPRLLASFPALTMVQIANNELPIIAFHLLEYTGVSYNININKINEQMWEKKEGSQMYLHNPFKKKATQEIELRAGIYKKEKENKKINLKFIKDAYKFSDLKNKNEYLFTDGIQKKGSIIKGSQRLRILNKGSALSSDLRTVCKDTKEFLKAAILKIRKSFKV